MTKTDSWDEWRKHVLIELKNLHEGQGKVEESLSTLRTEIIEARLTLKKEIIETASSLEARLNPLETNSKNNTWIYRLVMGILIAGVMAGVVGNMTCHSNQSTNQTLSSSHSSKISD